MNKRQERNKLQQAAVKTIGGRAKYFACVKTKQTQRLGIAAIERTRYRHNGWATYGYCL